ncbi:hypothetical protein [Oxynema aestuarii]|uniref:Uncharacterized protein n=1 Tax=Oxynema aestuarii AP17 TaxID=2064643 RepID=A0A6H1U0G5_9CYAN|nr:hypothetical protein [Oxynema aestuarii]QIZ72145.1 hypothetical protein HCG48_17520 [Oxynema aestuarii AP17]
MSRYVANCRSSKTVVGAIARPLCTPSGSYCRGDRLRSLPMFAVNALVNVLTRVDRHANPHQSELLH